MPLLSDFIYLCTANTVILNTFITQPEFRSYNQIKIRTSY